MAVTPRDIEVQRIRTVALAMGWEFRREEHVGDETLITLTRRYPAQQAGELPPAPPGS